MLKVSDYISLMKHCLGKVPDSRHSLYETFNRAGRQLFTEWDWGWLSGGPVDIKAVADQNWIKLPPDFSAIQEAYIDRESDSSGSYSNVILATLDDITRRRQSYQNPVEVGGFHIH